MDAPRPQVLDEDDRRIGRILSRREVLALLGATGATLVTAAVAPRRAGPGSLTQPRCSGRRAGRLIGDGHPGLYRQPGAGRGALLRRWHARAIDIRSDPASGAVREGLPLALHFLVAQLDGTTCLPLADALVDVWHCDALGVYSGVQDRQFDTTSQQWLRGHQRTDADGAAAFLTIYPGWYSGRAVHIHFKVRTDPDAASGLEFTSQLFFDDDVSRTVFALPPYAEKGAQDTPNEADGIYLDGGELLQLALVTMEEGYSADVPIGVLVG